MDESESIEMISPDSISSDKDLFKHIVIVCLNRIHKQTYDTYKTNDWKTWRALRASVGMLNAFVAPYVKDDKEYTDAIKELKEKLKEGNILLQKDMEYINILEGWTEKIVTKFSTPSIAILPPRKVTYRFGKGEEKNE